MKHAIKHIHFVASCRMPTKMGSCAEVVA